MPFPPFFIWFQFTKAKVQKLHKPTKKSLAKFAKSQRKFCKMFPLLIPAVPITGTISTSYRYCQYQLPVLVVPLTGTDSTNKRTFFDTAFENFLLYFGCWESALGCPLAKIADRQNKLQRTQSLSTYHEYLHVSFGTNFGC